MFAKNEFSSQKSSKYFPFFQFKGTHEEIGRQYGKSCVELIHKHLNFVKKNLQVGIKISVEDVKKKALSYRPYVREYASFLDEEIKGVAKGANISLGEAYLLQVRAEINNHVSQNECTTFAISSEATKDNIPLAGQNVDLPSFYSEIGVVMELKPNYGPKILMFSPAGQVSHIGISSEGIAVFANAITCDGWGEGLPRYMFSRLALTCQTVDEAITKLSNIKRSSARNIIMMDKNGDILNYENTPTDDAVIKPENGILAHTNHYLAKNLLNEEKTTGYLLENSQTRLDRMNLLLISNYKGIDIKKIKIFFRDRNNSPNSICQTTEDSEMLNKDFKTCASIISAPSKGEFWVAMGPPNWNEYKCYSFSE